MTSFVASIIPTDTSLTDEQRENLTTRIEAKIKEIDAAKEDFEEAKKEGKSAVFTRYDQNATDTFICELGAIPDDHIVECKFTYHMQLKKLDLSVRTHCLCLKFNLFILILALGDFWPPLIIYAIFLMFKKKSNRNDR